MNSSNALTKVSVSPNEYYMYGNDVVKYVNNGYYLDKQTMDDIDLVYNITEKRMCIVVLSKLRPLTVAERLLYVND